VFAYDIRLGQRFAPKHAHWHPILLVTENSSSLGLVQLWRGRSHTFKQCSNLSSGPWTIPSSASIFLSSEIVDPTPWNSGGASILIRVKSMFNWPKAQHFHCVFCQCGCNPPNCTAHGFLASMDFGLGYWLVLNTTGIRCVVLYKNGFPSSDIGVAGTEVYSSV
jgi:hypothetical protein